MPVFRFILGAVLLAVAVLPAKAAPPTPHESLGLTAQQQGLAIRWRAPAGSAAVSATTNSAKRLIAVQVPVGASVAPQISQATSTVWQGTFAADAPIVPQTLDGTLRPDLAQPAADLPSQPIEILRDSQARGRRIVVLALNTIFRQQGQFRSLDSLDATVPGAVAIQPGDTALAQDGPFVSVASGPVNQMANVQTWTVQVSSPGIQTISADVLAAAGLQANMLRVLLDDRQVPLEVRADGSVRFYATAVGDRWNSSQTYWLEAADGSTATIQTRSADCTSAPNAQAREQGVWRKNVRYDPGLAGIDGDHWFAYDIKTEPMQSSAVATFTLPGVLPPVNGGSTTLIVAGSSYTKGQHNLKATLDNVGVVSTWPAAGQDGVGNWSRTFVINSTGNNGGLQLIGGSSIDSFEVDYVRYERQVTLDLGGKGAAFLGNTNRQCYRMTNAPGEVYDVTDPWKPAMLVLSNSAQFEDDGNHQYIVAGTGTLHNLVTLARNVPADLATPFSADAVYIVPRSLQDALTPLVQQRQRQGYSVAVVSTEAIYDSWSFGQISPEAIRSFLRYTATWPHPPLAVTLVGDGSHDPLNYLGKNNPTLVPPYLASVDPWINETACDTCYVQLNGDNPLVDSLPDMLIGRMPVKSAAELTVLVNKLLNYENEPFDPSWRSKAIFLADNHRDKQGTVDKAGDFATFNDTIIGSLPKGIQSSRMYYDPWKKDSNGQPLSDPWRYVYASEAAEKTRSLLNEGAGLVVYAGHSNQYQMAVTERYSDANTSDNKDYQFDKLYLFGVYDVDGLQNGKHLPIMLQLTCLTGAFQTPFSAGTSIDERLVLQSTGGAAAVWGSSGLGVDHGHDKMQAGFLAALWNGTPQRTPVGALTNAGYQTLYSQGTCCEDSLRTYILFGDPLMPARVQPAERVFLPLTRR